MTRYRTFRVPFVVVAFVMAVAFAAVAQDPGYRLQPSDVIMINVYGHPDLSVRVRVTSDSRITFPLIGELSVQGFTVQELQQNIKELLEKDYLVNAQVLAFIEIYHPRQVAIVGEVTNPGKYDLPEEKNITFLEAIALAGGFTKDAALNQTKVIRTTNGKKEILEIKAGDIIKKNDAEKDIAIESEDIILVPVSFF